jgi:hypothetical protein
VAAYIGPPDDLPAFPDAVRAKSKTAFPAGLRARWRDKKGRIYEWDYQHGTVEVYSRRGRHLGEFDPNTDAQTGPIEPSRKIQL